MKDLSRRVIVHTVAELFRQDPDVQDVTVLRESEAVVTGIKIVATNSTFFVNVTIGAHDPA